jgi:hypothetical protein
VGLYNAETDCVVTARLSFDLAFENIIQAAAVAHPAFIKEEDLDVRR